MQNTLYRTYKGRWCSSWLAQMPLEEPAYCVGIKDHKDAMRAFSYELTEGECQKVMILLHWHQPRLPTAIEPTN